MNKVAALVLAAGRSTRMRRNKLLIPIDGAPMIERVVDAALASSVDLVSVVTGHDHEAIEKLLAGRDLQCMHNFKYASGMASSLQTGLQALPAEIEAVVVLLGDMPRINAADIDRLIAAHRVAPDAICVPRYRGQRGNPVLWPRRYFESILKLSGDTGARVLLHEYAQHIQFIEFDNENVVYDIDTEEELKKLDVVVEGI